MWINVLIFGMHCMKIPFAITGYRYVSVFSCNVQSYCSYIENLYLHCWQRMALNRKFIKSLFHNPGVCNGGITLIFVRYWMYKCLFYISMVTKIAVQISFKRLESWSCALYSPHSLHVSVMTLQTTTIKRSFRIP